jgi:RHS repeat-associated protein
MNRTLNISRSYESGLASNVWNPSSYNNAYYNAFTYDAMGNILSQKRHNRAGTMLEDMTYKYHKLNNKLLRNRLYHINDSVAPNVDATDIDNMKTFRPEAYRINVNNNYSYDEEGRLVKDSSEQISKITWRVDGKVKEIQRGADTSTRYIRFDYDAMGHRIAKHVYDNTGTILKKSTYYILDAQGNQISMYEHEVQQEMAEFNIVERNIFGSSRLGSRKDKINLLAQPQDSILGKRLGHKNYEFSNHLGNVLIVFTDVKTPLDTDSDGTVDAYRVCLQNIFDYSPFGAALDGRTIENDFYRRGFNGMEKDDEVKGSGNSYDFGARMYDSRVGRWLSRDLLVREFSSLSPYTFANDNPTLFIDPNGKEVKALNEDAKEIIKLGLTRKQAKFVKFDQNGMIDKERINKGIKKLKVTDGNFKVLQELVNDEDIYEVDVNNCYSVFMIEGDRSSIQEKKLSEIIYISELDDHWEKEKVKYERKGKNFEDFKNDNPNFSSEIIPNGCSGITIFCDESRGQGYSSSGNHRIIINSALKIENKVGTLAHELYGHGYFKSLNLDHNHGSLYSSSPDFNHKLENFIIQRKEEALKNYNSNNKLND